MGNEQNGKRTRETKRKEWSAFAHAEVENFPQMFD